MNGADWLIIAVVLVSGLLAASQGFFCELFSLAGVIAGYLLAAWEYAVVAAWYGPYVSSPWVANVAGFLTIFLVVVLLAGIAGRLARWAMKEAGLRWFDRVLGAAFGLVRGVLIVTVIAFAVASFSPGATWLAKSEIAPYLLVLARAGSWVVPGQVRQQFRGGLEVLRQAREGKTGSMPPAEAAKPLPPGGAGQKP